MNARLLFLCLATAVFTLASPAVPEIRDGTVSMEQGVDRTVTIRYTLDNGPAIITVDILTNGVPLTGALLQGRLAGDINRKVASGTHEILWRPNEDERIAGDARWAESAVARVTAWPTNAPPTWMVVDLTTQDSVEFYPDETWFPKPITDDLYKTDRLVMRKIPAANVIYRIGSPANENGRQGDSANPNEIAHQVMLTSDYYIGVYEVTQAQYKHLKSLPSVDQLGDTIAVGNVRWRQELRGAKFWPTDGHEVAANSFMQLMRTHACGIEFDLPTEAQWEIACRADEPAAFNNGCIDYADADGVAEVAWTSANASQMQPVGLKKPNRWGLYDMHGNAVEWCLDLYASTNPSIEDADAKAAHIAYAKNTGLLVDPVGPAVAADEKTTGAERGIAKGGSFGLSSDVARAARRYNPARWSAGQGSGFRLCCPACLP